MSEPTMFRFNQATFDFGDGLPLQVDLVADQKSKSKNTHFTLLMGANGTCKSRILSSCVNLLRHAEEKVNPKERLRTPINFRQHPSERDLECVSATIVRDGVPSYLDKGSWGASMAKLPSRVLAIANLVKDRFTFAGLEDEEDPFYLYLGVRQASNLTTTGAMDRLVSDAFLNIVSDADKYASFTNWVEKLFPGCKLGLAFTRFSVSQNDRFLSNPDKWVKEQLGRMRSPQAVARILEQVEERKSALQRVLGLINEYGSKVESPNHSGLTRIATRVLQLEGLPIEARENLGEFRRALSLAASIRLLGRPSLILNSGRLLDFIQLSSGEQNLLATGARLIGFAEPGSLIVIDEPEVSLNVAWQQRYIELISDALKHASGSHVIIASHSPYLVADLHANNATVVVIERVDERLRFKSHSAEFWGWGSEAILYEVLGLHSASNYHFSRELAAVLKLVSEKSKDVDSLSDFLKKCDQLDFDSDAEPLKVVIEDIRNYAKKLKP